MLKLRKNRKKLALVVIIFITIFTWQLPFGSYVLYPFTILGTWFHEMGHGLMAMILGAEFIRLELFYNGSGLAVHSGNVLFGNIGRAMVAAAGPIGPTIAGALFIIGSRNDSAVRILLFSLAIIMILSVVLYVRTWFGALFILIFAVILFYFAMKAKEDNRRLMLQFLGIQAFASLYLSLGYLFSSGGEVGGSSYMSDTAVIADKLFLPHWFWAGAIIIFSLSIMIYSIFIAFKGEDDDPEEDDDDDLNDFNFDDYSYLSKN